MTPDELRQALRRWPTGITVVATELDGDLHGMTANSFTSVSLEPPLVLVCVDHTAYLNRLLPRSERFTATMLAADQEDLSAWFASARPEHGEFDEVDWKPAPVTGCPVLTAGLAYVDCVVNDVYTAGDHDGLLRDADPLLYVQGRYNTISPRDR